MLSPATSRHHQCQQHHQGQLQTMFPALEAGCNGGRGFVHPVKGFGRTEVTAVGNLSQMSPASPSGCSVTPQNNASEEECPRKATPLPATPCRPPQSCSQSGTPCLPSSESFTARRPAETKQDRHYKNRHYMPLPLPRAARPPASALTCPSRPCPTPPPLPHRAQSRLCRAQGRGTGLAEEFTDFRLEKRAGAL